jgi:hypothetical protein
MYIDVFVAYVYDPLRARLLVEAVLEEGVALLSLHLLSEELDEERRL